MLIFTSYCIDNFSHGIWILVSLQISAPHNESDKVARGGLDNMTLVEVCALRVFPHLPSNYFLWILTLQIDYLQVGPRFCLNPIKIFGGSFGGPTLYENPLYISPNQVSHILWSVLKNILPLCIYFYVCNLSWVMANIHWCGLLGSLLLFIIVDSGAEQTEKGRKVCEESQGEDEKKDARAR